MIELINVSKSYKTNTSFYHVLKNVNLVLPNRGFISVLGKSGSGKTTLLNILGGIDDFDDGTYLYNNIDVKTFNQNEWDFYRSNAISFVFQDENLINFLTVKENLEIVLKEKNNQLILDTLDHFGLKVLINKKPNELSGGEKQRIAIVRALLKESKIIFVDEPTGNLDQENARLVLEILKEISKNKLVFMITHDIDYAIKYSDEIIKIKDGVIIQEEKEFNKEMIQPKNLTTDYILKLNFKQIMHFVFKTIKTNFSKTIQYITLLTISIFMIGLGLSTLFVDEYSVASNNFMKSNVTYIKIKSPQDEVYNNEDYIQWNKALDNNVFKEYDNYTVNFKDKNDNIIVYSPYYIGIDSITYYNQNVKLLYGNKPVNNNEIVISDYLARSLIENKIVDVNKIEDIIDNKIIDDHVIVVGIYDTDYEKYQYMFEGDTFFFYQDKFDEGLKSQLFYKLENYYTNVYVNENFDFSELNILVNGRINPIDEFIKVSPLLDNNIVLNNYSNTITQDNEIIVSIPVVYQYIKEKGLYNFDSFEEFMDLWDEKKEDFSKEIIGNTLPIDVLYQNQNNIGNDGVYAYLNDFKVVGIDNNKYEKASIVYMNSNVYNSYFKENYSLVAHLEDTVYKNEQLIKTIREKGYYYETDASNNIIKLVDADGPIMLLISFSVGGVFILFTFLLFNNLISRDILNRRKEIGLLRTLGMSLSNISKLFIFEVLFTTCISLILVNILEPFGIYFLNKLVTKETTDLTLIFFSYKVILGIILFGVVFTALSILLPIREIKKLSIVNAIKSDEYK